MVIPVSEPLLGKTDIRNIRVTLEIKLFVKQPVGIMRRKAFLAIMLKPRPKLPPADLLSNGGIFAQIPVFIKIGIGGVLKAGTIIFIKFLNSLIRLNL
ncbi:hypothetical protein [Acetobacter cerevisiae]|uniref:hypothetical protein n=1 Tax=Acetobacter cerevisiae TaxID=178900 RepID=UPI000A7B97D8|nr:hypothetical protein [Acetobacter cerevisiae]